MFRFRAVTAGSILFGSAALLIIWRRLRASSQRVLAVYSSQVTGRSWYKQITVTEERCSEHEVVRGLHLGGPTNTPESLVRLRVDANSSGCKVVADTLLKPHVHYSLLAFAWLPDGFPSGGRAALVGVAGGSLLHFWRECVPGGAALAVDAVEIDGAVLEAARAHLELRACEPPRGNVAFHVQDGRDFLRDAEDESYDLLVIDLDMGALADVPPPSTTATRATRALAPDPTRDMYRVLSSSGVLVINEYSEETPSRRLESTIRLVRQLRRYFPEVHQIRTTTHHNTMLIAPVERGGGCDANELARRASSVSSRLGLGGIDLGGLLKRLPPNRHQVYS